LMPRLFMGIQMEDRVPIIDILEQTPPLPDNCQWALFLRNHDELTLEMVTDEERDYMYRVFARDSKARLNLGIRRRLAPLLGNDRRKIELLNLLLMSMPGTPVLYYGDEIGMGDNIYLGDRNGVRTPMQWSSDKNAGFSRARPPVLPLPVVSEAEYHYESVNVEAQQRNENSLFWWSKRLINLRKRWKAFGRGDLQFIATGNRKVLAFTRSLNGQSILVVANLSRLPQPADLMLGEYNGCIPVELWGNVDFPQVASCSYRMTLAAYAVFWFWLKSGAEVADTEIRSGRNAIEFEGSWNELLAEPLGEPFAKALKSYLRQQTWFLAKNRRIESLQVVDLIPLPNLPEQCLVVICVELLHGETEEYAMAIGYALGSLGQEILASHPGLVIVQVNSPSGPGVVFDAIASSAFLKEVVVAIGKRRALKGRTGTLRTWKGTAGELLVAEKGAAEQPVYFHRSNSSVAWNGYFLKLFGKLDEGPNPEIEMIQLLQRRGFSNVPPVLGTLEHHSNQGRVLSLGYLTKVIPDGISGSVYTQENLDLQLEQYQARPLEERLEINAPASLVKAAAIENPGQGEAILGTYYDFARLLGQRTGEMHGASSAPELGEFSPEIFTPFYLRSLYQSWRNRVIESLTGLRANEANYA